MTTLLGTEITEIFGDSVVTNVSFKFQIQELYVDQTTPVILHTRFKNHENHPISNFDPGICRHIQVFHNGQRLPQPLLLPELGQMKFLVTPVETNVFLVKYETFQHEKTVIARTAWGESKDFQSTGTICQALTNCWATLKNPICENEKLEFKCNRECQFGLQSDVGVVCLCEDVSCLFTLVGNTLKWSTPTADGDYALQEGDGGVRLCVKLKKDRVVEICSK